ncbi:MAG: hypothetical protein U9P72_11495, partial [Campylobacterota bacterium]|nr:hypothetical protein [Campylobacterota bacterium]
MELAQEAINECRFDIDIKNNQFVFNKYDYYDGENKASEIKQVESLYIQKFNIYLEEVAQEERLKIEEEKRIMREEKADLLIANAKKQGYKLKKEIREDNTIKLVLQKRTY